MRIAIASRIFAPEPAAASFRLEALAEALVGYGHQVDVLTVRSPENTRGIQDRNRSYRVSRFPVLRDSGGQVRGYMPYLSFDLPLFFRILFGPSYDMIVAEPPPTTGFFVRIASFLRRSTYSYYSADIWSDASEATGASRTVLAIVRKLEQVSLSGASTVLSVNEGMASRAREIAPTARVVVVGNGADTSLFTTEDTKAQHGSYLIYSGTASEWQGAAIFIEALDLVKNELPHLRLVFLGQGTDWQKLQVKASQLPEGRVTFLATVGPEEAADWIRGATASVASLRPDSGYSFAFPTKVYASWACGTPVVYAGSGQVREFFSAHENEATLGIACDYDPEAVAASYRELASRILTDHDRRRLGGWAASRVSLEAAAKRAAKAMGMARDDERPK